MPKYISMKELDAKAQELGTIGAALKWAEANGYAVNRSDPSAELPPVPGQTPVYEQPTGALQMAAKPNAEPSAEPAQPQGGLSEMQQLRLDILAYPGRQAARRKADFEAGQKYLAQMYAGPSTSQQLFALSKALLSPKPYRGFAGTMANISGALGDISMARDEAQRKRAQAALELQKAYNAQTADSDYEALKLRYQLASDEAEAMAKEGAARMPKYELSPLTGKPVAVPKYAHRPVTKAEYDAIPVGDYYVIPAGPQAGEVVRKLK